jgi:hypothetical protein
VRLKEDSASWHASGLIVRDARHDGSSPEVAPHRSKKDCKRWCRGKVGREHDGEWRPYKEDAGYATNWRILVCKRCNKHLDTCWSWMGKRCKAPNHGHAVPQQS